MTEMSNELALALDAAEDAVRRVLRLDTDAYLHVKDQPGRLVKVSHIAETAAHAALASAAVTTDSISAAGSQPDQNEPYREVQP